MFCRVEPKKNGGSRKRQKVAHNAEKAGPSDSAITGNASSESTSDLPQPSTTLESEKCCTHEQSLKKLEPDLEAMRQLITCKICQHFLTEPYVLACGHAYCYICLNTWLVAQKKRTCPDCRAQIKQQPVPSFIIKEMVLIFCSRQELLSDGETLEENKSYAKEAAEKVAQDKTGPSSRGLFQGLFSRGSYAHILEPVYDEEDRVHRCPLCHHELENGICSGCGEAMEGQVAWFSGSDELDYDLGLYDDEAAFFLGDEPFVSPSRFAPPARNRTAAARRLGGANSHSANGNRRSPVHVASDTDSEDASSSDETDETMDGFIVRDNEVDASESEGSDDDHNESSSEDLSRSRPTRSRRTARTARASMPIVIDSEDDEIVTTNGVTDSDEDSDEGPVARGSQRVKRSNVMVSRRTNHITSSDDDSERDTGTSIASDHASIPLSSQAGFSSMDEHASSSEADDDDDDENDDHTLSLRARLNRMYNPYDQDTHDDHYDTTTETDLDSTPGDGDGDLAVSGQETSSHPRSQAIFSEFVSRGTRDTDEASLLSSTSQSIARGEQQADHPFQLSNTLHNINRRAGRASRR